MGADISPWQVVSIHAPREGCDRSELAYPLGRASFNSRTPGGVRLGQCFPCRQSVQVSIHAPREGCDIQHISGGGRKVCFNSRTPGGVRLLTLLSADTTAVFQFTHPGRGATSQVGRLLPEFRVSIHAPREGCDEDLFLLSLRDLSFNSRTPGGVRLP